MIEYGWLWLVVSSKDHNFLFTSIDWNDVILKAFYFLIVTLWQSYEMNYGFWVYP